MSSLPIIETVQIEYRGQVITLTRMEHPFHGSFWNWRVGDQGADSFRHASVANDMAHRFIDLSLS